MGKSSKAPPPTDPAQVLDAQVSGNRAAQRDAARFNQIGEITPFGTRRFAGTIGQPDRRAITTLAPALQRQFDLRNTLANRVLSQLQGGQFGDIPGLGDFSADRQRVEQASLERAQGLLNPIFEDQEADLRNSLAVRGIPIGSELAERELDRFDRRRNEAQQNIVNDAILRGGAEQNRLFNLALAGRGQVFNELGALSASAVPQPQLGGIAASPVLPTDIAGAIAQRDALNAANAQAAQQTRNSALGGLFGAGSAAIAAGNPFAAGGLLGAGVIGSLI